jgi:putative transposase
MEKLLDPSGNQATAHFVTLCAFRRQKLLGDLKNGQVVLTEIGQQVDDSWRRIETSWPEMTLDIYIIMPNHFHALFWISTGNNNPGLNVDMVMKDFLAAFKDSSDPVWQPGWQTRSIDTLPLLSAMRGYIKSNPAKWHQDPLNPESGDPSCRIKIG